jgi:hypothetical protein
VARRDFAVFDGSALPPQLDLELGGLQVVVTSTLTSPRSAVSTVAVSSGRARFEALFWGADGVLTGAAAVGVAGPGFDGSLRLGEGTNDVAFWPGEGAIRAGGVTVAAVAKAQLGDVIGVELDLVSPSPALSFSVNGVVIYSGNYAPPGSPVEVFAAVSVSGAVGALRAFANFGQRAFEYGPLAPVEVDGWFQLQANPPLLRFSTATYTTAPTDTPANTSYEGRVRLGASFEIARAVSFWPWGSRGGQSSIGQLEIIDPDGRFDGLLADDYRDAPVILRLVEEGAPLSSATTLAEGILERVEASDDSKRLVISGKTKRLDVPLQRRLFLPDAVESAANTPRPVLIGAARNIEPVLFDESGQRYAVSDRSVSTIAALRDRGDPLEIIGSPGDWTYLPDSSGVDLNAPPVGKLTADASSVGNAGGGPPVVDVLGGIGNPFVSDGGSPADEDPVGWVAYENLGLGIQWRVDVVGGGARFFRQAASPVSNTNPAITVAGSPSPLIPGRGYRLRFSITTFEPANIPPDGYGLEIRHGLNGRVLARAQNVGAFLVTFVAESPDLTLQMASRFVGGAAEHTIIVEGLTLEDANDAAVADATAPLPGVTLEQLATEIIETRAGLGSTDWSSASAAAADPGQYGSGLFVRGAATCRQALESVLDCYAAALYEGPGGDIAFARLRDPALELVGSPTVEPDWVFGASQVLNPGYAVQVDPAEGLTTAAVCRRNHTPLSPSDLVDDLLDVPPATRALFGRRFQLARYSAVPVGVAYRHAVGAAPVEFALDDPAQAQAEIDRVAALYNITGWRRFVSFSVAWTDAQEYLAKPGDIVRLDYAAAGVSAGSLGLVYSVRVDVFRRVVSFGVWL